MVRGTKRRGWCWRERERKKERKKAALNKVISRKEKKINARREIKKEKLKNTIIFRGQRGRKERKEKKRKEKVIFKIRSPCSIREGEGGRKKDRFAVSEREKKVILKNDHLAVPKRDGEKKEKERSPCSIREGRERGKRKNDHFAVSKKDEREESGRTITLQYQRGKKNTFLFVCFFRYRTCFFNNIQKGTQVLIFLVLRGSHQQRVFWWGPGTAICPSGQPALSPSRPLPSSCFAAPFLFPGSRSCQQRLSICCIS
jgi:hypothetical protein